MYTKQASHITSAQQPPPHLPEVPHGVFSVRVRANSCQEFCATAKRQGRWSRVPAPPAHLTLDISSTSHGWHLAASSLFFCRSKYFSVTYSNRSVLEITSSSLIWWCHICTFHLAEKFWVTLFLFIGAAVYDWNAECRTVLESNFGFSTILVFCVIIWSVLCASFHIFKSFGKHSCSRCHFPPFCVYLLWFLVSAALPRQPSTPRPSCDRYFHLVMTLISEPCHSTFRRFIIKQIYHHLACMSFDVKGGTVHLFPFFNQRHQEINLYDWPPNDSPGEFEIVTMDFHNLRLLLIFLLKAWLSLHSNVSIWTHLSVFCSVTRRMKPHCSEVYRDTPRGGAHL